MSTPAPIPNVPPNELASKSPNAALRPGINRYCRSSITSDRTGGINHFHRFRGTRKPIASPNGANSRTFRKKSVPPKSPQRMQKGLSGMERIAGVSVIHAIVRNDATRSA